MSYREIENLGEISSLGKKLQDTFHAAAMLTQKRTIGFPGNNDVRDVSFLDDNGIESLWFANWNSERTHGKVVNLFGRGNPDDNDQLAIDVQFNYNDKKFSRELGGAFLKNENTGDVIVAHRGIITKKTRLRLDVVFDVMASEVIEGVNSKGSRDYLFIARLNSKDLISEICDFSKKLRTAVQNLDLTNNEIKNKNLSEKKSGKNIKNLNSLRTYLKEFNGKRREFTPKKVFPECNHGKIVNALELELSSSGETLNSIAVDLVVDRPKSAILFEVKTNSSTQSIYTAVGQLTIHKTKVAEFTKKPVTQVLVIPENPMKYLEEILARELRIKIITYSISANGKVTFDGLKEI